MNVANSARSFRFKSSFNLIISTRRTLCQEPPDKNGKDYDNNEEKQRKINDVEKEKKKAAKLKMNDLLKSLANMPDTAISKVSLSQPKPRKKKPGVKTDVLEKDPYLDASLKKAVADVVNEYTGDAKEMESDLFASLKSHSREKSLSELLSGMKIDRSEPSQEDKTFRPKQRKQFKEDFDDMPKSRLNEFRRHSEKREHQRNLQNVELFSGPALNIFPKDYKGDAAELLPTWEVIAERERKIAISQHPRNGFEEMIQWTQEGKLWTFPIDNEIGLEEEKKFSFADHIFLEGHLEGWCPQRGPIRRYMELVCTGLSKNPHLTVQRKKDHIEWYKNYFHEKAPLLKEIGAM